MPIRDIPAKLELYKLSYDYFKQDLGMTVPAITQLITKQDRIKRNLVSGFGASIGFISEQCLYG